MKYQKTYTHNLKMDDVIACVLEEFGLPVTTTLLAITSSLLQSDDMNDDVTETHIAHKWMLRRRCLCLFFFDPIIIIPSIIHCLKILKRDITCSEVEAAYHHSRLHNGILPNVVELHLLSHNMSLMDANPEAYHEENKVIVSTPNVEDLPQTLATHTSECMLCQDDILPRQKIFHVPCCNQTFHADPLQCVGGTIKDWLKTSRRCPLCKKDVLIEKKEDHDKRPLKKQKT